MENGITFQNTLNQPVQYRLKGKWHRWEPRGTHEISRKEAESADFAPYRSQFRELAPQAPASTSAVKKPSKTEYVTKIEGEKCAD